MLKITQFLIILKGLIRLMRFFNLLYYFQLTIQSSHHT